MTDFYFECNEECNCCFDGEVEQCEKYGECFYCYYSDNCNNQSKCIIKGEKND